MKTIDNLIQRYDHASADAIDFHTQAKLKMIKALFAEIKDSKDCAYMEEIIGQFAELVAEMQDTIDSQMDEIAQADEYRPMPHSFMPTYVAQQSKELPSCFPPEGGFQTDEQVKKAFTNYLTYHVNRKTKNGKDKPFSIHTIYDYSSRLKVLWEIVYKEWQESNGDNWIQLNEQKILPGCTYLNVFHNIDGLHRYIRIKETQLQEIAMGHRDPIPAGEKNPLNNLRNLANSNAALMKFADFRDHICR